MNKIISISKQEEQFNYKVLLVKKIMSIKDILDNLMDYTIESIKNDQNLAVNNAIRNK